MRERSDGPHRRIQLDAIEARAKSLERVLAAVLFKAHERHDAPVGCIAGTVARHLNNMGAKQRVFHLDFTRLRRKNAAFVFAGARRVALRTAVGGGTRRDKASHTASLAPRPLPIEMCVHTDR